MQKRGILVYCHLIESLEIYVQDVVKTRLQVQGKSNVNSTTQYNGAWDAARTIYKHEGYKGFTKGMTSRMLWVAPSATIMFTTYDQLMKRMTHGFST